VPVSGAEAPRRIIGLIEWNDSVGNHAPNQAQKESQIAETVADDARPCVSCALCNKGKRYTRDCHANGVPESRLHEQMED
jgi:hypothetical protein